MLKMEQKPQTMEVVYRSAVSEKSRTIALLLCIFLGYFGIHRIYVGRIGTGILYFFTFGIFGIGWLFDILMLLFGSMKDGEYAIVKKW